MNKMINLVNKGKEIKVLHEGLTFSCPNGFTRNDFEEMKRMNGISTTLQYCLNHKIIEIIEEEKFYKTCDVSHFWETESKFEEIVVTRYIYNFVPNVKEVIEKEIKDYAKREKTSLQMKIEELEKKLKECNELMEIIKLTEE